MLRNKHSSKLDEKANKKRQSFPQVNSTQQI